MTDIVIPKAQTVFRNGQVFDFDHPTSSVMTPAFFGYGLKRINRWNGHASLGSRWLNINPNQFITISEEEEEYANPMTDLHHSFLVYLIVKDLWPDDEMLHLAALIHDACEVIYGDIIGPIKKRLASIIKPIEHKIEGLMAQRYGCPYPWDKRIKYADLLAQDIEGYLCFSKSVIGVNVRDDSLPTLKYEKMFWEAYTYSCKYFISLLAKYDKMG